MYLILVCLLELDTRIRIQKRRKRKNANKNRYTYSYCVFVEFTVSLKNNRLCEAEGLDEKGQRGSNRNTSAARMAAVHILWL